jgi:hypothetical protein
MASKKKQPSGAAAAPPPGVITPVSVTAIPHPPDSTSADAIHARDQAPAFSAEEAAAMALSPIQRLALEKMVTGYTLVASATAAGVTRSTLYRWLKNDSKFQAAYNAWQQDAVTSAKTRVMAMADDAVATVARAVKSDARLAFGVLKTVGILDRAAVGSTDSEEIDTQRQVEEQRAQEKLGQELFFASLGSFGGKPTASQLIAGLQENKPAKPAAK